MCSMSKSWPWPRIERYPYFRNYFYCVVLFELFEFSEIQEKMPNAFVIASFISLYNHKDVRLKTLIFLSMKIQKSRLWIHFEFIFLGHKEKCEFKDCTCRSCLVVVERQKITAARVAHLRQQRKVAAKRGVAIPNHKYSHYNPLTEEEEYILSSPLQKKTTSGKISPTYHQGKSPNVLICCLKMRLRYSVLEMKKMFDYLPLETCSKILIMIFKIFCY